MEKKNQDKQGVISVIRIVWGLMNHPIRKQKKPLLIALFLVVISTFGSLLGPFIIKEMIDKALPRKDSALLLYYSGGLLLTFVVAYLCWITHVYYTIKASENIFLQFRQMLFESIMNKRMDFFEKYPSGDILTRLTSDLEFISSFFNQTILRSIAITLFAFLLVVGLIIWNWSLGLTFVLSLPFLYLYTRKNYRSISEKFRLSKEKLALQNETLLDLLGGIKEIRFFQQGTQGARGFFKVSKEYTDVNISSLTVTNITAQGLELLGLVVRVLPFIVGGLIICRGNSTITIGMLVAYFMIFVRLSAQIFFVFQSMMISAQILPAINRLKEIIDFPEDQEPKGFGLEDVPPRADIEIRLVSFAYPNSDNILTNFNFHILPGEKVAIMGPSGSGKSTLAQLILRFLQPSQGTLFFGGKDIWSYPLSFYLSFFAYVSQETHLFKQTIRENIAMGWVGVPMENIYKVASLVRMDDVIERLPQQYDTVYGQAGLNLSGGQKQRLALARALIRDPEILVLDEFTAGLDREVEDEILDDLFKVFQEQTIICITHKQDIANRFDRVVHLSNRSPSA